MAAVHENRNIRLARWALALGGTLLAAAFVLFASLAPLPEVGGVVLWEQGHSGQIAMSNELLFFAALGLAVACVAVATVYRPKKPSEVIGFASLALGLVVLLGIVMVEGRLVYGTGTGQLAADSLLLVTSLVYGGLHTFLLLAGFSFIAFGMSLRSRKGSTTLAILIVAGVLQIVGAYPWLTPQWFNVFAAVALWLGTLYASRLPVKEV